MVKLIEGNIYNGWRLICISHYMPAKCDGCGKIRNNFYEFIHPETPYGDNWNGFVYDDEPLRYGAECVKKFLNP